MILRLTTQHQRAVIKTCQFNVLTNLQRVRRFCTSVWHSDPHGRPWQRLASMDHNTQSLSIMRRLLVNLAGPRPFRLYCYRSSACRTGLSVSSSDVAVADSQYCAGTMIKPARLHKRCHCHSIARNYRVSIELTCAASTP
jgi:hypothetical protein